MAEHAGVPVVNALTDEFHPCQVLADLLTIREHKRRPGRAHAHLRRRRRQQHGALLLLGRRHRRDARADRRRRTATTRTPTIVDGPRTIAAGTGGSVECSADPDEAVDGADVLVTDTWVVDGPGGRGRGPGRGRSRPYQVNDALLAAAGRDAIVLHCLPAHRGKEITAEVIDGPHSVVWDEAENRLHAQKALLAWLLRAAGRRDRASR